MEKFKQRVKDEYNSFLQDGFCKRAKQLNDSIGTEWFDTSNPHFFTGNPNASLVMVTLNPKRDKPAFNAEPQFKNFEDYWEHYRYYGKITYGEASPRKWKSKFDLSQLQFLQNMEVIDFVEEKTRIDNFANLEKVIDEKFQLELVPYGSPSFNFKEIGANNLKYFLQKTVETVCMANRKYVFFCGAIFRELFWIDGVKEIERHRFKLVKNNGENTRDNYELIKIKIKFEDNEIIAAILPQFARQGGPMKEYAKKVKELY